MNAVNVVSESPLYCVKPFATTTALSDFPSVVCDLDQLPIVCNEQYLTIFKHYWQGQVHDAVFHNRCLYLLQGTFSKHSHLQVYNQALQWAVYGREVLVTSGDQGYKLWVEQFCMLGP